MTSEVAICNLALSHLGDAAEVTSISPPDETAQAGHCAAFYPIVRGALLEMHPWPFATKRAAITGVANTLDDDWGYAYALPTTCLRPLQALYPGVPAKSFASGTDAEGFPYLIEALEDGTAVMYTNVETATLRYIDLVTDTTKYSPLFVVCLARLLASYLAGPVLKGDMGMKVSQAQLQIFEREFRTAAGRAANVGKRDFSDFQPRALAARGGYNLPRRYFPFNPT